MRKQTVVGLVIASCLLHLWAFWHFPPSGREPHEFDVSPPPSGIIDTGPVFIEGFISSPWQEGMAHAGSICALSDGSLAAAWYAGSREGARDVAVYFSRHHAGEDRSWTEPRVIASNVSASEELDRFVKKVGNSVIFSDREDRLWLIYVTIALGGWSGSSLNLKTSDDLGATWSKSERLTLSPFFNVSELVRNAPLPLKGGGFAIPIYHEFLGRFPEMLYLQANGSDAEITWSKARMAGGRDFIQPSVVAFNSLFAAAFFRCMSDRRTVAMAVTRDGGRRWSKPDYLDLPNPNSALNALLLADGKILLAFNDSKRNRSNLRLAISEDQGTHWVRIATIEDMEPEEFSYPYMIRDRSGKIHLVYTWCRKRIKHVIMNDLWVEGQLAKAKNRE